MDIVSKIIGIIVCVIGLVIWGIDYLIFTAIGALTAWIAGAVGITGMAVLGLQIIGWIITLGIMVALLVIGVCIFVQGIALIFD